MANDTWDYAIIPSGSGSYGTADDSLQFDAAPYKSTLTQNLGSLRAPDIGDGQCLSQWVQMINGNDQDVYIPSVSASALVPLQISIGGKVTTVTAGGKVTLFLPGGASQYQVKFTRASGPIIVINLACDNIVTAVVGASSSSGGKTGFTTKEASPTT